ncbi:MAG: LamG-like jellyroll fold domain-containing protein, partial [bacterium]
LEAWVNRATQNTFDVILVKGAHGENAAANTNFAIDISNTNVARVLWENEASENFELWGETQIIPGQWYHISGVRSSQNNLLQLYVNGVLDGQLFTIGKPNTQDIPILLGFNGAGFPPDHHFAGYIDEVRIWNKPRTQDEIFTTANKLINADAEGLIGYWRFDTGTGQIVNDLTANGNHGFLGAIDAVDSADPSWSLSNAPLIDSITVAVQPDPSTPEIPLAFELYPNCPNPFNPETSIQYSVSSAQFVSLKVYDLIGQEIATLVNRHVAAGNYEVQWDGRDWLGRKMASGVYLYRLRAGEFVQSRKMLLAK